MNETSDKKPPQTGWTQRFIGVGSRLEEMVQLYRGLGFEVRLEAPALEDLPGQACESCFLVTSQHIYALFTRPKASTTERGC